MKAPPRIAIVVVSVMAMGLSLSGCLGGSAGASGDMCIYYGDAEGMSPLQRLSSTGLDEPEVGKGGIKGKECGDKAIAWCNQNFPADATKPDFPEYDLSSAEITWQSSMEDCYVLRVAKADSSNEEAAQRQLEDDYFERFPGEEIARWRARCQKGKKDREYKLPEKFDPPGSRGTCWDESRSEYVWGD